VRVVDNDSRDGTVEMVGERFPFAEVIANDANLGFAAATNQGIRAGIAPAVLALNPDTRVKAGSLDRVLDALWCDPRVGVVGPKLLLEDGSMDHAARRRFPTPLSALGHFAGIAGRPRTPGALTAYRAPDVSAGPVDAVNGAFMLMRRSAVEAASGFDEGYWMYMEDLDLCYRLRQAGWLTWFEPSSEVVHVKAGTSGPIRGLRLNIAFHRGMGRFYRSHYAPSSNPLLNWLVYAGIGLKLAASLAANGVTLLRHRVARR